MPLVIKVNDQKKPKRVPLTVPKRHIKKQDILDPQLHRDLLLPAIKKTYKITPF